MKQKLPPLNALKSFEATARLETLTQASKELFVTPSAVHQQIALLEKNLGKTLFIATGKKMQLTEFGQHYFPIIKQALALIANASYSDEQLQNELILDALHSFADNWLSNKLNEFQKIHPEINIILNTNNRLIDFQQTNTDFAIRYGRGHYQNLGCEKLSDEITYAVCSPSIAEWVKQQIITAQFNQLTYLLDTPLLGDDYIEWDIWFKRKGISDFIPNKKTTFTSTSLIIQSALRGEGVMMARDVLIQDYINNGRLCRVDDINVSMQTGYYLVYPSFAQLRPTAKLFRRWLIQQFTT